MSELTKPSFIRAHWQYLLYGVIVIVYLSIISNHYQATTSMRIWPDSQDYYRQSASPLWSKTFWAGERSPFLPLVLKMANHSVENLRRIHWVAYFFSWALLGIVISSITGSKITSFLAPIVFYWYSLTEKMILWHDVVLSESLFLSIFACALTSWILYLKHRNRLYLFMVVFFSLAFSLIRDTNAYIILIIACIIGGFLLYQHVRSRDKIDRHLAILFSCYLCLFLGSTVSHNVGGRWILPFFNVISQRILPHNDATHFFVTRGMPVNEALMSRAGKMGFSDNFFFENHPELEKFRRWSRASGKSTYTIFLLSQPAYLLMTPMKKFEFILKARFQIYAAEKFKPIIQDNAWQWFRHIPYVLKIIIVIIGLTGAFVMGRWPQRSTMIIITSVTAVSALIALVVAWHGDAMEVYRHCLPAIVQFEIAFILASILLFDSLLSVMPFKKYI